MLGKINQVNSLLQSLGSKVVQKILIGNRPALYGYKPQFVIDSVNEVFGAEHWHYQLHDTDIYATGDDNQSGQVVVSLELFMRADADSEFICHGIQCGQSQIVHGNIGDAKKGAITDALGKNFSLFSIGKLAYRGELETVFHGQAAPTSTTPQLRTVSPSIKSKPVKPSPSVPEQGQADYGLPNLPGVTYETASDGTIVAQGDTYNNRTLLKSLGFIWLPKEKAWGFKQAA